MMCRSKVQEIEEKTGFEMALGRAQLARGGGRPGFKSPHCSTGKWLLSVKRQGDKALLE